MRLIDADTLEKYFTKEHELGSGIQAGIDEFAIKCIRSAPTVDAVSVVRCKDCKYGVPEVNALGEFMIGCEHRYSPMKLGTFLLDPDFYCADGERIENK